MNVSSAPTADGKVPPLHHFEWRRLLDNSGEHLARHAFGVTQYRFRRFRKPCISGISDGDLDCRKIDFFEFVGRDVKLFFTVGNCALDTFIASWDSIRYYDSSRPWTLIRHYYKGKKIKGWTGPGKGVADIMGDDWHPYSPSNFITPPFPGYVSGHSCISGGCAEILKLFTGSDKCGFIEPRHAGEITEQGFTCQQMQQLDGRPLAEIIGEEHATCDIVLPMPTFTEVAEMAGISRVMGGYHIQADNVAGLKLGRDVAQHIWPKILAYFDGTAELKHKMAYESVMSGK